jgi:hypothetical protein
MNDKDSVRILQELEEATGWVDSGDLLAANDPGEDDGLAGVPSRPHLHPIDGGAVAEVDDSLERDANPSEILSTVRDMSLNGAVEDMIVIVNTPDGEQLLFTTLGRNDHIIGMLSVATLNWHSSQIAASNFYEEEGGV